MLCHIRRDDETLGVRVSSLSRPVESLGDQLRRLSTG
ncbi:MbeD/MobD family mobilization/exclusion protein [Klebsiella pneumoniae]|nr:hypothetical protein [Klebsiella pneumoniae]